MIDLKEVCFQVQDICKKAGVFIREEAGKIQHGNIEAKGNHDFVTYVDKTVEQDLVTGLQNVLPESGFITEEKTIETQQHEFMWVIDPLDGTTNFIHGLPCFSISVGLMHHNQPIVGVVYEVNLDECFYSWKGAPAYLNGKQIHVSNREKVNDSLLATGFPYHDYSLMEKYLELFVWCMHNSHGVRRIGSAAVDLAYVACGRFEAFFEYGLNPWDVMAGAFIVEQAGGKVSDFKGDNNYIFGRQIIASNSMIYDEFLKIVKTTFR